MGSTESRSGDVDEGEQRTEAQFVVGQFYASFGDESAARAAARDARAVGFVIDVQETSAGQWAVLARRREPFPHDEQQRYAARLGAIASSHGGTYKRFVAESAQ